MEEQPKPRIRRKAVKKTMEKPKTPELPRTEDSLGVESPAPTKRRYVRKKTAVKQEEKLIESMEELEVEVKKKSEERRLKKHEDMLKEKEKQIENKVEFMNQNSRKVYNRPVIFIYHNGSSPEAHNMVRKIQGLCEKDKLESMVVFYSESEEKLPLTQVHNSYRTDTDYEDKWIRNFGKHKGRCLNLKKVNDEINEHHYYDMLWKNVHTDNEYFEICDKLE